MPEIAILSAAVMAPVVVFPLAKAWQKRQRVVAYLRAWHRAFTWPQRIAILLMVAGGLLRGWWALTAGV